MRRGRTDYRRHLGILSGTHPVFKLVLHAFLQIITKGSTENITHMSTKNVNTYQAKENMIAVHYSEGSFSEFKVKVFIPKCN